MITPYITYREDFEDKPMYFIVQKEYPHYLAEISEIPKTKIVGSAPIGSYNLWVAFIGCLRGNVIPSYLNVDKEIADVLFDMAEWYFINRILGNEKKYKKWKM